MGFSEIDFPWKKLNRIENLLNEVLSYLERMEQKMAVTQAEFDAAMAALKTEIGQVATDIAALRAQLAAGVVVTDQNLADLQSDLSALQAADPQPAPAPVPAPPAP